MHKNTNMAVVEPAWRRHFTTFRDVLGHMPLSLTLPAMRIAIGIVFFNTGLLKARSFEFAVKLFAEEYHLLLLPLELAARLALTVELGVPLFQFAGFANRLVTLPLIGMTLVIVTLVYPASWVESLLWSSVLVMLLTRGHGVVFLDHLIEKWMIKRYSSAPNQ